MVDKVQKLWHRLSVWVVSACAVYSYIYWGPVLSQMATAQTIELFDEFRVAGTILKHIAQKTWCLSSRTAVLFYFI